METVDIIAKCLPRTDTQSIDYALDFLRSGTDPPDEEIEDSTQETTDETAGKIGGTPPDLEKGPDPEHKAKGFYTYELAKELAQKFKKHLNRLDELRETIVYVIKDSKGRIMKYGETAAGFFKSENMKNILKRPYRQIQKLKKQYGADFDYKEVGRFATKREARGCQFICRIYE